MTIRVISQESYPEVVELAKPLIHAGFTVPKNVFTGIAGFENNVMVAYILLFPEMPGIYSIPSLATKKGEHGKGYMKELFTHLFEKFSATWWLEVHKQNERAIVLYKNLGFTFTEGNAKYADDSYALLGERISY